MKILSLILFVFGLTFFINIFDDYRLFIAQEKLANNNLEDALEYFKKIKNQNDETKFNVGKILQTQENYEESIEIFSKITKYDLQFEKFYNIAVSYEKMENYDDAILYYKRALGWKNDNNAKKALEKLVKKQNLTEVIKMNNALEDDKFGSSQEDNSDDENKNNGKENKEKLKSSIAGNDKSGEFASGGKTQRSKNERERLQISKMGNFNYKRLSDESLDVDDKKWLRELDSREIKTLLIPIGDQNGKNMEQNGW